MRDSAKGRSGFDRVLMAVAATFITVSAGTALAAQPDQARSAADLAIDAAIPRPEPANVPPPTAADFKSDTTSSISTASPDVAPATGAAKPAATSSESKPDDAKPADVGAAPTIEPKKDDTATAPAAAPPAAEPTKDAAAPATEAAPAKDAAKEPAPDAAKTASSVPAADQPVADKLRDLFGAKSSKFFDRKAERTAIEKFYTTRDDAPLWTQAGALTATAKGVIARLQDAAADGLDPTDYPVPNFAAATTPDALAEADLKLTASMMDYARQAQSGRMHWSQVSADIQYPEHPIDPTEVLTKVTSAKDASIALDSYNPPQKLYRELKQKLAELRGEKDGPVIHIAEGPTLRYKPAHKKHPAVVMEDDRVPQLRAKLNIDGDADDTHYDGKVAEAVRKFQARADLKVTGVLDDRTVKAINSPRRDRQIDTIVVNMERWRWLPRQLGAPSLGNAYAILNIPDYSLKVMHNGAEAWKTRVVVGKPGQHATPLLTETMKYITVNPTWNVPPSIIYNEYLPALQQDPTVLDRMGLKLEHTRDGIHISQPPGERNALGRIRFNFPNKFLVYQHDTPDKYLFAKEERAFSHGCMRVQNPDQYAATLLDIALPNQHYTPEKIRSMYGHNEIDIKFPTPIPVNITYQTAFVDDAGKLQFRKDVYGRDGTMEALLRNSHGKDLETVVAHSQPSYARPPNSSAPSQVTYAAGGEPYSGPSFFERLFGGPPAPPPGPPPRRYRQRYQ